MIKNNKGKCRWTYDVNLYENHSIRNLVYYILAFCFFLIIAALFIFTFKDHEWNIKSLSGDLEDFFYGSRVVFFTFLVILVIAHFSYRFVCKIYGGTYKWEYEMDENGIRYWQPDEQKEKFQNIAKTSAVVGGLTGNPGLAGTGLYNSSIDSFYCDFSKVRNVWKSRKSNLITCRHIFMHHMIYVDDENLDFVYDYIKKHCPRVNG